MKLYSYVVEHDYGHAPNPYYGVCTLDHCKCRKSRHAPKNVVELVEKGDWIVGTGGANQKKGAGHENLVYAMEVNEKLTLAQYWHDSRFKDKRPAAAGTYGQMRGDNKKPTTAFERNRRYVLISWNYYYFGKGAGKKAKKIPREFLALEKKGPGFKKNFAPEFIGGFINWLQRNEELGMHGEPWGKEYFISKKLKERQSCESSC